MAVPEWRKYPEKFCPMCKSPDIFTCKTAFLNQFVFDILRTELLKSKKHDSFIVDIADFNGDSIKSNGRRPSEEIFILFLINKYISGDKSAEFCIEKLLEKIGLKLSVKEYSQAYLDCNFASPANRITDVYGLHCRKCEWSQRVDANISNYTQKCNICSGSHKSAIHWQSIDDAWFPSNTSEEERNIRWQLFESIVRADNFRNENPFSNVFHLSDWLLENGFEEYRFLVDLEGGLRPWRFLTLHKNESKIQSFEFAIKIAKFDKRIWDKIASVYSFSKSSFRHNKQWVLGFPPGSIRFGRVTNYKHCGLELRGSFNLKRALEWNRSEPFPSERGQVDLIRYLEQTELFEQENPNLFSLTE